jgi:hypothetical protein
MQAAARGDTGSGEGAAFCAGALGAALAGAIAVLAGGKLVFAVPGAVACGAPCGFTSSFLHIRHLDGNGWIFEVVGLEGGATQKLQDSTGFSVCKVE